MGIRNEYKANDDKYVFQDLWDRVGYVEITIGDEKPMVFKGLDFKFNVTKVLADMVEGTCSVQIHGLTQDTMNKIVTLCNQQVAIAKRKMVKVYAGYSDQGGQDDNGERQANEDYEGDLICCMDILYASVTTPPPELWVTIEGVQSAYYRFIHFKYNKRGPIKSVTKKELAPKTLMGGTIYGGSIYSADLVEVEKTYQERQPFNVIDLCEDFVKCANIAFQDAGVRQRLKFESYITEKTKQKTVTQFNGEGAMSDLSAKIGEAFDVFCYIEPSYGGEDILVIMDKPENVDQQEKSQMDYVNQRKKVIRTIWLDVNKGLIGIPSITNATCLKCRCLLNPKLSVGDYIYITSEVMPAINNTGANDPGWQVNRVTYTGHMRGTEWYCDITAVEVEEVDQEDEEK